MLRTDVVRLKAIDGIAYRQKLGAGGSGITIISPTGTSVFSVSRRGDFIPFRLEDFSYEPSDLQGALKEAFSLTRSLPFKLTGSVKYTSPKLVDLVEEDNLLDDVDSAEVDVVTSAEYEILLQKFTDKFGRFSYLLMNKDLIQFASGSSVVKQMQDNQVDSNLILHHTLKSRLEEYTRRPGQISDVFVRDLIEILDAMNPRSAFKELNAWLRRAERTASGKRV